MVKVQISTDRVVKALDSFMPDGQRTDFFNLFNMWKLHRSGSFSDFIRQCIPVEGTTMHEALESLGLPFTEINITSLAIANSLALSPAQISTIHTFEMEPGIRIIHKEAKISSPEPECLCDSSHLFAFGHVPGCSWKRWKDTCS